MTLTITSLANPRIKAAVKLRDRKGRVEQGRFLIDGTRELAIALAKGIALDEVFVCPTMLRDENEQAIARDATRQAARQNAAVYEVSPAVMEKLDYGDRKCGIVVAAKTWVPDLAGLKPPMLPLVLVLENVEKPGNLGAVLRTADAAGVSAVIVSGVGADPFNPNAIQASRGAVFTVPFAVADSDKTMAWLSERKLAIYAARVDAAIPYTQADYRRPAAIVLGSEAHGLSETFRGADTIGVQLPMRGEIDSLNVSVAAAVLCYEAVRQRT